MAAPVFQTLTSGNATATSIGTTLPSGTAAGDLLVIFALTRTAGGVYNTPAGYTYVTDVVGNSSRIYMFYKIAGSSESAPTLSVTTGTTTLGYAFLRFTGHDPTTPIDAAATAGQTETSANTTWVNSAGVTPSGDERLVLAMAVSIAAVTFTGPGGYTEILDANLQVVPAIYTLTQTTATATGSLTFTGSGSSSGLTFLTAIAPPSAGTKAPPAANLYARRLPLLVR